MQKPRAREQWQKHRDPRGLTVRIARRARKRDAHPVSAQARHRIGRWSRVTACFFEKCTFESRNRCLKGGFRRRKLVLAPNPLGKTAGRDFRGDAYPRDKSAFLEIPCSHSRPPRKKWAPPPSRSMRWRAAGLALGVLHTRLPSQEALSPVSPSLRPVPQDEECRTMTPAPIYRTDAGDEGSSICFARIADMNFLTGRAFARGAAPKPQPRPRPHAHPPRPSKKPLPSGSPPLQSRKHPPSRRQPPRSPRPCAPHPRPRHPPHLPSRRPPPHRTSQAGDAAAKRRSSRPRRLSP